MTPSTPTPIPTPTATSEPGGNLFLDLLGPLDGATVQSDAVVVYGFASVGAQVSINGKAIEMDGNGRFQAEVELSPGVNSIEVVALGMENAKEIGILTITSLVLPPQPFFLLITQPEDQSIVSQSAILLAGRTSPAAVVSVNGVSLPVDAIGIFSTTVKLDIGPNIIDVVATDADGEVLSTVIAIIYRP